MVVWSRKRERVISKIITQSNIMSNLNIKEFLDKDEKKDLLRLLTAGSVDDGKSTLIGRLLFDSKKLYEDQLDALERDSKRVGNAGENIDYALLLDGLKAEREQGITIDVAYRYFSTNSRKFIIADTPGHEQYTRNMITGGSTAKLAIILVDARAGVITQTRRHTYLVSLLGIKHIVLAVNKMDLVDYSQERFDEIVSEYMSFASGLTVGEITPIPLSALNGDNVVELSDNLSWYKGKSLLDFLETVEVSSDNNFDLFRFPVQTVLRPNLDFRGFAGKVASGVVRKGDTVMALPSGKCSKVKGIHVYEGEKEFAFAPESVTITLEDEIDLSRGEMLVHPESQPMVERNFDAMLVWMDEGDMDCEKSFFLKHTTQTTRARIEQIEYKVNVNTMEQSATEYLKLNEIGRVSFVTNKPLLFDSYQENKNCGSFILIDPITNNTSAVGMIIGATDSTKSIGTVTAKDVESMRGGNSIISATEREELLGQSPKVIMLQGENARECAYRIERSLFDAKRYSVVVDLPQFDDAKIAEICEKVAAQGYIAIAITASSGEMTEDIDSTVESIVKAI
ncbi:MAG: sulfate adenylyltransferase subunit CysN [Rikenellaceae bacterium]